MNCDTYTKFVLTVIALALLWISVQSMIVPQQVAADDPQKVIIVGWNPTKADTIIPVAVRGGVSVQVANSRIPVSVESPVTTTRDRVGRTVSGVSVIEQFPK